MVVWVEESFRGFFRLLGSGVAEKWGFFKDWLSEDDRVPKKDCALGRLMYCFEKKRETVLEMKEVAFVHYIDVGEAQGEVDTAWDSMYLRWRTDDDTVYIVSPEIRSKTKTLFAAE